jgi:head-tail adaptor
MISAGLLRWTATMLAASTSQDTLGLRSDTFTTGGTFRCDMRNQSAQEQAYADGVAVRRTWELRARWQRIENLGLTEVDRISVDGRTLKITSIINLDGADRVAVIQCEEVG